MFLFTHTHTPSSSLTGLLPVCTTRVIPAVTALKYRDALTLAVGTSTGQVGVLPTQPCLYQPSHTLPLSSNQLQLVVKLLKALSLPSFPCFCPPPPPHAVFIALLFPLPSLLPMQSSLPSSSPTSSSPCSLHCPPLPPALPPPHAVLIALLLCSPHAGPSL